MANSQAVFKLYKSVIDDVINNVREAFLDEGVDEQVLQELKQIWEAKLMLTRAVDPTPQPLPQAETSHGHKEQARGDAASEGHMQAQLQAVAEAQQRTAAGVGGSVIQQQGTQAFQISGAATQLSSSAAAATLAFQQGVLQIPHQLTSLPAGLTLAQPEVTQTFPAYTISQPHGTLQAGSYQAVLPTGQTVMIHPSPQTTQTQQQQPQQATGSMNLTTVQARVLQVDGPNDTSDEEEDDEEEEEDDHENDDDDNEDNEYANDVEEAPLNSDDDVSDEDPSELFETENVVVCQYDKINRSRNKWKFHLKNGIMNLKGRDYIFFKASGDAEW